MVGVTRPLAVLVLAAALAAATAEAATGPTVYPRSRTTCTEARKPGGPWGVACSRLDARGYVTIVSRLEVVVLDADDGRVVFRRANR